MNDYEKKIKPHTKKVKQDFAKCLVIIELIQRDILEELQSLRREPKYNKESPKIKDLMKKLYQAREAELLVSNLFSEWRVSTAIQIAHSNDMQRVISGMKAVKTELNEELQDLKKLKEISQAISKIADAIGTTINKIVKILT